MDEWKVLTMLTFLKETVLNSPAIMVVSILLLINEAITVFEVRIVQAKKDGSLPSDYPELPVWTRPLYILEWVWRIALLVLNWKYALGFFFLLFILKVLPVLETIGNVLMAPFKPKGEPE